MSSLSRPKPERRYLFDAHATTLRGNLTRPDKVAFNSSRTLSIPLAGGDDKADDNGISFGPVLSIAKSTSYVDGKYNDKTDTWDTTLVTTIEDLSILEGRLTAKLIEARLTSSFSKKDGERSFSIEGSRIEGLYIENEHVPVTVETKPFHKTNWKKVMQGCDSDHKLRGRFEEVDPGFSGRAEKAAGLCSVAGHGPMKNDKITKLPGSCFIIPDFGRIWLAELHATPDTWRLTMLRAKLGSPAEGEFEIADVRGNGQGFPP